MIPQLRYSAAVMFAIASMARADPVDVTHTGTASQTSEWNGGQFPAALAIDGVPSTFSHTSGSIANESWQLLFDEEFEFARVELVMRTDCCGGRLTGATLRLLDGEGDSVFEDTITDPGQGGLLVVDVPPGTSARTLRVGFENGATNPGTSTTYIHLGEVRVFEEIDVLPAIESFEASPGSISAGASSELSWQVSNADTVEIAGVGTVGLSGSTFVSPTASEVFTLIASNANGSRSRSLSVLVDGELLPPRITEFMSNNASTLVRSDGVAPDWIEIWNPNPVAIDLQGYALTDDAEEPARYVFPSMTLAAGSYLIVDANSVSRDGVLATGFRLGSSAGSYLALMSPQQEILQLFEYPGQHEDVSYGIDWDGDEQYFLRPSPGEAAAQGTVEGFVADTEFSVRRGFYDQAQTVTISSATPMAVIYITLDGSEPSPDNPQASIYPGPLTISSTTILRAAAFRAGYLPTNIDTQTYIFPATVSSQSASPEGFPAAWVPNLSGVVSAVPALSHYGMDAGVLASLPMMDMNGESFDMSDALQAIPSMSLVMDIDELLDPVDGIHVNAQQRGRAWERRASIEYLDPGTGEKVQANCGVRTHGGWNRFPEMLKKSFRLYFRSEYGDSKLKFPLFADGVTDEFDRILLRSGNGKAWPSPWRALSGSGNSLTRTTYLRDQFMRDLQAEMGNDHVAGSFVHLYVNGHYWGLYNPVERPDEHFGSSHFGGLDEDYDVMKWIRGTGHVAAAGSDEAWNELIALSRSGPSNQATYDAMAERLDLPNFVDYMLLNFYAGNGDWVDSNVYALRDRGRSGPYKFYCWDSEETFLSTGGDSTGRHVNDTSTELHHDLRANIEYRVLFGDRAQKHFFNGGALTQERAEAVWMRRASEIDRAIVGDSARWGNLRRPSDPYDRADWIGEIENIRDNYLSSRIGTTLTQLRNNLLFPGIDAPEFLPQRGGLVDGEFELWLSPPGMQEGTVYFTTDGSDPRAVGGAVSPTAMPFTGGVVVESIVSGQSDWLYLDDGSDLGASNIVAGQAGYDAGNWKHIDFDDLSWAGGPAPLGYGGITGTTIATTLGFGGDEANKYTTTYFRHCFNVAEAGRFSALRLRLMRDDGAIVYLNGNEIVRSEFPPGTATVTASTFANGVGGLDEGVFLEFPVSQENLVDGENILAVEVHQASLNSSDLGFDLELSGDALPLGAQGIAFSGDTLVRARVLADDGEWSALDEALYVLGDRGEDLYVSEIMYHPASPSPGEAEFLEIANRGEVAHHLPDLRITGGIQLNFSTLSIHELAPAERLVLVRDQAAFESAYPGVPFHGVYEGALGNGGDSFSLALMDGTVLWTLSYDDSDPWPGGTDGGGDSLTFVAGNPDTATSWRPSVQPGGTPGTTDAIPLGAADDLLGYALVETFLQPSADNLHEFHITRRLGADDAEVSAQWSEDLLNWNAGGLTRVRLTPLGDGTASEVWMVDAQAAGGRFFRAIVRER